MKNRLLYLAKVLNEDTCFFPEAKTKEEKETERQLSLSMDELISKLSVEEVHFNKKTVWSGIETLNQFFEENDLDILINKIGSTKASRYRMEGRLFEEEELMLILAAVDNSRFLTRKKRNRIFGKLKLLTSKHTGKKLDRFVQSSIGVNMDNEHIYYTLSVLTEAIENKRKVRFEYIRYKLEAGKKEALYDHSKLTTTPLAILYFEGNCYLLAYADKRRVRHGDDPHAPDNLYDHLTVYRVDRMDKADSTEEEATENEFTKSFDVSDFARQCFGAWSLRPEQVVLQVDALCVDAVLDRFKFNYTILPSTDAPNGEFATVSITVMPSPPFFGWVSQFGGGIKILSPESVQEKYVEYLRQALDDAEEIIRAKKS